jgi:anti-sigma B factor antagonist
LPGNGTRGTNYLQQGDLVVELYYHDLDQNVLVLGADGGLNSDTANELMKQLEQIVEAGVRKIIVDCTHLDYITSVGIAKLMYLHRRLAGRGGDVRLACVKGALSNILQTVHLNKVFAIYGDVEQARLSFKPPVQS